MQNRIKIFTIFLFGMLVLSGVSEIKAAEKEWEEVKYKGRHYVTWESFCRFYRFPEVPVSELPLNKPYQVKSPYGRFQFKPNSREIKIDGCRIWLSFPIILTDKKRLLISKLDLVKLIDPLLRRVEIAPRKKVKGVVIDPGHGGKDKGAKNRRTGYTEKAANLDTAIRLEKLLKKDGIKTVVLRKKDYFIELRKRSRLANKYKDYIFVSIHYNAGPSYAHGVETFCMTPRYAGSTSSAGRVKRSDYKEYPGNKHDFQNVLLADYIQRELIKMHSDEGDRGVKRARFVVLRDTKIPAALVEGGFMSHRVDGRLVGSSTYRQKVANATYKGVKNYMKLMVSPVVSVLETRKPEPSKPGFREPRQDIIPRPAETEKSLKPAKIEELPIEEVDVKETKEPDEHIPISLKVIRREREIFKDELKEIEKSQSNEKSENEEKQKPRSEEKSSEKVEGKEGEKKEKKKQDG